MKRPGTLFHTIVVVGASIGAGAAAGCGADEKVLDARTGAPDGQVADARPADASPFDAAPDATPDGMPDAMIVIL
jgi:hypothetical protein